MLNLVVSKQVILGMQCVSISFDVTQTEWYVFPFCSPDVNFDELSRCTDDYNGAMLKAVCVEAVSQKSILSFSVKYDVCSLGELALPSSNVIRDLTKLRRRRQGERQKSNRFNEQNNNSARASRFFVHFFAVPAQLRREMTKF